MIAKTKRGDAERAAEWALVNNYGCVNTVRAVKTKYQRQDLFASDVIGKDQYGEMVFCQVTTGKKEALRQRRKKLEKIPWQLSDTVLVFQMDFIQEGRSKKWFFNVFEYVIRCRLRGWLEYPLIDIKKEWFKAYRKD